MKQIVELAATNDFIEKLESFTLKNGYSQSQGLSVCLDKWYNKNKENTNIENIELKTVKFRLDNEVIIMLTAFIQNNLEELIKIIEEN